MARVEARFLTVGAGIYMQGKETRMICVLLDYNRKKQELLHTDGYIHIYVYILYVYTHMLVFTRIFLCSISQEALKTTPIAISSASTRYWFLIRPSHKRNRAPGRNGRF